MAGKLQRSVEKQLGISVDASQSIGMIMYSTGFINVDYLNGFMVKVNGNGKDYMYTMRGIPDGSSVTFIGRPHCGKTTMANQIAGEIARQFEHSKIYHYDIEGGSNEYRFQNMARFNDSEMATKYNYRDKQVTSEFFHDELTRVYNEKKKLGKTIQYNTGVHNYLGKPVIKYEPTIVILDSIPLLYPDDVATNEKMDGSMAVASTVKANSFVFKKMQQLCREVNIIILAINHIQPEITIGVPKKTQMAGIRRGERLSGGEATNYLANTMFRVDDGKKLTPDEGFGISGNISLIETTRSRTNCSLKKVPMIFDQVRGFDNYLSIFQLLKSYNRIGGAGSHLYIEGYPEIKFSQRGLRDMLATSNELKMILAQAAFPYLRDLLPLEDPTILHNKASIQTDINDIIAKIEKGDISMDRPHIFVDPTGSNTQIPKEPDTIEEMVEGLQE